MAVFKIETSSRGVSLASIVVGQIGAPLIEPGAVEEVIAWGCRASNRSPLA
jgi:hypothetical protein